jgi:hypothetical protein
MKLSKPRRVFGLISSWTGVAVDVGVVAIEVAAGITLLVAALVLFLDFGQRVHRAFALFLVLRAMMDGMLIISQTSGPGFRLRMYWFIAVPFAALHFCLAYRRRHGRHQQARPAWVAPLALLAVALGFEALYFFDHRLFLFDGRSSPAFSSFDAIRFPAYAAVAWVFAADYRPTRNASGRRALLLASVGFALTPLYFCTYEMVLSATEPWGLSQVYYVLSLALVADAARRLLVHTAAGTRTAVALVVGTTLALGVATPLLSQEALRVILSLTALAVPLCITYALVKHRLFDAEVKLRFAVKGTTLAAAFLAVFLVVDQIIQVQAGDFIGGVGGAVAAGLLLFALHPLQRVADRIAYKAVPKSGPLGKLSPPERARMYREQLEIAWADGRLTAKERLLFTRLQERLGISAEEAQLLETEVLGGTPAPKPKRRRAAAA